MNSTMPVAWIFILFMVLVVFGALAAIIWRSWIVGSIVLLFIFLVFGLYFVRAVPNQAPAMVTVQESTSPPAQRWEPEGEMLERADVYPSLDDAAKNLALRMCDNLLLSQPPVVADQIHIVSAKNDRTADIVKNVFGEKYPQSQITLDDK